LEAAGQSPEAESGTAHVTAADLDKARKALPQD
jgi:hypothetical protein